MDVCRGGYPRAVAGLCVGLPAGEPPCAHVSACAAGPSCGARVGYRCARPAACAAVARVYPGAPACGPGGVAVPVCERASVRVWARVWARGRAARARRRPARVGRAPPGPGPGRRRRSEARYHPPPGPLPRATAPRRREGGGREGGLGVGSRREARRAAVAAAFPPPPRLTTPAGPPRQRVGPRGGAWAASGER